ncbi:MAG: AI-2E family transporter [Sphingobacteriales bacterium]|nr:MAG: AI-2E family transporter [Sphingobacteriales bacterium]
MANFNNRIRQVLLIVLLVVLAFLIVRELYVFLPGFLGAVTLYILSREWFLYLTEKRKWNINLSATIFLIGFLVLIGLPVYITVVLMTPKIEHIFNNSQEVIKGIQAVSAQLNEWTGRDLLTDENFADMQKRIANFIPAFLNSTAVIAANLGIMLFVFFFMLKHARQMEKSLGEFIPLREDNVNILAAETKNMVKANAIGIPLISIVQGVFALIGYLIFGINDYVLWGFMTGVFAFFPIVGTMIVWVPLVVYLFANGHNGQGIGLAGYSLLITGNVDYLARITLMRKLGDVHPLITVLGVIVGLSLFGFWGFIFGPLLVSYFLLLYKIYTIEFGPLHDDTRHHHG